MLGTGSLTIRADALPEARGDEEMWVEARNDPGMAQVIGAQPPVREGIGMVHCWNVQTHGRRVMEPRQGNGILWSGVLVYDRVQSRLSP